MLLRKHLTFESELIAVQDQVHSVELEAARLGELFPDAKEHVDVRRDDTVAAWKHLQLKSKQRRENLQQSADLQAYFDQYEDLK